MRFDAPFVVMRRAPLVGWIHGRLRITVYHRAYSLEDALHCARDATIAYSRRGTFAQFWISAAGAPAHLPRRRK